MNMADSKWKKRLEKGLKSKTKKLPAKKEDLKSGKNISRICSVNLLKSLTNLSKKLSMVNRTSNLDSLWRKNLTQYWKKKAGKLQALTKYPLKFER